MNTYLNKRKILDEIIKYHNIEETTTPQGDLFIKVPYEKGMMYKVGNEKIKLKKGSHTFLYGWNDTLSNSKNIVITEGIFDQLSLQSIGIHSLTNTTGVMSTLKVLLPELTDGRLKDKNVFILFDFDIAGFNALKKVWQFTKEFPNVKFCYFESEDGLQNKGDVNDFIMMGKDIKQILNRHHTWEELQGKTIHDIEFSLDTPVEVKHSFTPKSYNQDMVNQLENAKAVPFTDLATFDRLNRTTCKWHNDTNASLQYYPKTNTCYCWACGKYADTIEYVMKDTGKSFKEALDYLAPPPKITVSGTILANKKKLLWNKKK